MAEVSEASGGPVRLSAVIACYLDAPAIPLNYQRLCDVFSSLTFRCRSTRGATMTVLSFLAAIYQIIDWLRRPQVPHGLSAIIVLILLFGSLIVLAISIVGEYLIKIFEETKRRPKFIRRAIRQVGSHFRTTAEIETFLRGRSDATPRSIGG